MRPDTGGHGPNKHASNVQRFHSQAGIPKGNPGGVQMIGRPTGHLYIPHHNAGDAVLHPIFLGLKRLLISNRSSSEVQFAQEILLEESCVPIKKRE